MYSVFFDSPDAKDFHIKFHDGTGSSVQWHAIGYYDAAQFVVDSAKTFVKDDTNKGAWYYVSLGRGVGTPAGPGDSFRLKVDEHPCLKAVTGVKAYKTAKKSLWLKWSKQANATKYQVKYKAKGGSWKTVTVAKNSVKLKKLKTGTKYQVKVRAYCKSGWNTKTDKKSNWGSWSTAKSVRAKA